MHDSWFADAAQNSELVDSGLSVLQQFLNGSLDTQAAALQLSKADPGLLLVTAASQIQDIHPQLVEIVVAMDRITSDGLYGLYTELRERWNHLDPDASVATQTEDRAEWVNLNAWAARLATHLTDESLTRFGFYSLREALEQTCWQRECQTGDSLTPSEDIRALDGLVPAAAQWILLAGREILGSKYDENMPGIEIWPEWKNRFIRVERTEGLEEVTKKIARDAVRAMDSVHTTE